MEHYHVYKFLATFYFAAELGKPPKQLQDHPNIKYNDYMDEASLNAIWRKIAVAGKDGKSTYFWQAVETALNEDCRDLFLRSSNSSTGRTAKNKLRISLDDDKVHFQFKTLSVKRDKNHLCGMGGQMHARSGVKGMTIDSAVSAATGFPLCFRVRRQGETERDNYDYMLRFMFQSKILARLQGNDPLKAKLLRENPSLVDLSRGDVPPFYVEVGEINGQPIIQGRSCYHIAHPNLCTPCNTDEQEDDQLAMIVASSSSSSDASPTRAHWLAQSSNL